MRNGGKKFIVNKIFESLYSGKDFENLELEFLNKTGKVIPMSVSVSAMYDKNAKIEGIVIVARDLTELKESVREKEVLLREIHHRVKNNLQLISSMLDLQSEQNENKFVVEKFKESQNRIKLMASLHEQLYQSSNLRKINFGEHIQVVSNILLSSYNINRDNVAIKVNIKDIYMGVDMALLCSLIVNELISNSLKYAFPEKDEGEIIVDLHFNGIKYRLDVSDNGVGFPTDVDFRNTKTLGLKLVNMFVEQLKGDIELYRKRGTRFLITFKPHEQNKEVSGV